MKMNFTTRIYLFLIALLSCSTLSINAQIKNLGLPYIINYSSEDYHASKQNWAIVEDKRGVVYFGNTLGVLEFDGQNWRLISLPNNSIVRSLAIDDKGRIYVGSRGDFGYLTTDSIGSMKFISLLDKIESEENRKFTEDINRIFISNGIVYFTCDGRIFEYNSDKVNLVKIPKLKQTYEAQNRIFVRIEGENGGFGEFVNGAVKKIQGGDISKELSVRAVLPYEDKLLIVTMANGLYLYDNNKIEKLKTNIDNFLEQEKVLSALLLADGSYAFGFFSNGLLITDKYGNVKQHLNLNTKLPSGLIPYMMQDSYGNLWLCTGIGMSYILTNSPLTTYSSLYGLNSTVYSAFFNDDNLYTASATGLFYRKWDKNEMHLNTVESFQQLGDPMNIWNLDTLNSSLLAATSEGIYLINKGNVSDIPIHERTTVWKFLRIKDNNNLLLAGTNKGFIILEYIETGKNNNKIGSKKSKNDQQKKVSKKSKSSEKWQFKYPVRGFSERCRHVEIDKNNDIWFSDKAKGVARLVSVNNFDSVSAEWYNKDKGLPEEGEKFVFRIKDDILISTEHGFFIFDFDKDMFVPEKEWDELIGKGLIITSLTTDKEGNIWFKQQRTSKLTNEEVYELGQLVEQKDGKYLLNKTPFYKFKNNIHAISPLPDGNILIGTDKGFIHYDPTVKKDYHKKYNALVRKVEFVTNDSLIFDGSYSDNEGNVSLEQKAVEILKIPYGFNNIRFTFSAPFFEDPDQIHFKYYLEGNDETWSDWKIKNFKEYSNLLEGNYTFHVIAKNIYEVESEEAIYKFTILPPWYRTIWAFIGYIILVILLIYGIVRLSVRRLRLQKEHLEILVEERTAEIRQKNVELEQQKEEILAQRDEIEVQKDKIEDKNKNITASITYAKRIQEAMLPLRDKIDQAFDDYFILFKPRDIVSGDFYWFSTKNNKIILTAVDCTGHGVPGAFMSMIGSEILTTIVGQGITVPAEILDYMNRYVRKALKQDQTENQDGMDMSLCTIDKLHKTVEWGGAKNPMVYVQNNELIHLKGDMQSIGGHQLSKKERQFSNHTVSYESGPTYFYIFTDGFQDQFGGGKGRKFMIKSLKELIFENYQKPMKEQQVILNKAIEDWKFGAEQTDDILVIGFKLTP